MSEYTAPATLITSSCKIAKNTTDGWTKTLYSAGDPVTYASWDAFLKATADGTATPVFTPTVRAAPLLLLYCAPVLPCEQSPWREAIACQGPSQEGVGFDGADA